MTLSTSVHGNSWLAQRQPCNSITLRGVRLIPMLLPVAQPDAGCIAGMPKKWTLASRMTRRLRPDRSAPDRAEWHSCLSNGEAWQLLEAL